MGLKKNRAGRCKLDSSGSGQDPMAGSCEHGNEASFRYLGKRNSSTVASPLLTSSFMQCSCGKRKADGNIKCVSMDLPATASAVGFVAKRQSCTVCHVTAALPAR
jgi:hypothetical protein